GVRPQRAAGCREREPMPLAAALEEAHVQRILERADARAHRRLREPQRGRGTAEAAERPDRQKRLDLRDFHQPSIPEYLGVINIFYTGDKNNHVALFTRAPHSGGDGASATAGSIAEEEAMSTMCECGVTLEQPGRMVRCQECDVAACPSCVIHEGTAT